jgi:hypothetical protein
LLIRNSPAASTLTNNPTLSRIRNAAILPPSFASAPGAQTAAPCP